MKTKEIEEFLTANDLCVDALYEVKDSIKIEICWGDWKHDHLRCKRLMEKIGYIQQDIDETDIDGSDCYSAVHTYVKSEI